MKNGFTLWLTGVSGSGKTTSVRLLEQFLRDRGARVEVLDGDLVRGHLCKGLGFSREGRFENVRRVGFVCEPLSRNGVVAIAALIIPYREMRERRRRETGYFVEVCMECPLEVSMERDVKGLYKKALAGEIGSFTGISGPYEPPWSRDMTIHSANEAPEEGLVRICAAFKEMGRLGE